MSAGETITPGVSTLASPRAHIGGQVLSVTAGSFPAGRHRHRLPARRLAGVLLTEVGMHQGLKAVQGRSVSPVFRLALAGFVRHFPAPLALALMWSRPPPGQPPPLPRSAGNTNAKAAPMASSSNETP